MEKFKRWCKKRAPGYLVLVVLLVAVAFWLFPAGQGLRDHISASRSGHTVQPSPSQAAGAGGANTKPTHKSQTPDTMESDLVGTIELDPPTWANISSAVRTWAGYPNRTGRAVTLAKLRHNGSVSPVALKYVALQWSRPQPGLVKVDVESVNIHKLPTFASGTEAILEGVVIQGEHYSDGKITHVRNNVGVNLQKVGGVWRIVQLVEL